MRHDILLVAVIALVTALLRFLPFRIFGSGKETPPMIQYLGKVLPYAMMGMLVIYCLKGLSFRSAPYGIPELIAVAVTAVLQYWKGKTLVSIACGTGVYMLLIRLFSAL